jgi:hypothetical protein
VTVKTPVKDAWRPASFCDTLKQSKALGGLARVSAEESPELQAAGQPHCIKCNGMMSLAKAERKNVFGYHYELRTFRCDECGFGQTYTMGRS